jgi:hypothetical protein
MVKRLLPFLIIILVAVPVALFFWLYRDKEVNLYETAAIDVIPEDAYWIIESHSVPELLKGLAESDPLYPTLQLFAGAQPYLQALETIDSLLTSGPRYAQAWAHNPAVISMHQVGKSAYQVLMVIEKKGTLGVTTLGDFFSALCGRPGTWSQRTYNNQVIHRISFGVDALIQGVSLAETDNLLIVSPSPVLLENAVRQQAIGKGFAGTETYRKLSATRSAEAAADIYLNLKMLPRWLGSMMNPTVKRNMEMFNRYGDWAVLDLNLRNDALWLAGFALEGDTLNSYLNIFSKQLPLKLEAEQYLPSNTAAFFSIGIEKPEQYFSDLEDYLAGGEQGRKRQNAIGQAVEVTREDVVKSLTTLGFKELTIGYLTGSANDSVKPMVLISTANRNQTLDKLLGWLDGAEGVHAKQRSQRKIFRIDPEHEYAIYPMPFDNLPEILGGGLFSTVKGKYFSFLENELVLCDNLQALEDAIHFHAVGRTLATDPFYLSVSDLISTRSNATFYAVPHKARPLLGHILNQKTISSLATEEDFLLKTGAVCLQFHSSDGMFLHNLFARFTGMELSKPQTLWESRLDAPVLGKPAIVKNHSTKAAEILVQDQLYNLYLITASGRILWKKAIGEQINSDIFQIDLMKNGRLQYLFSTPSAIHLLDRTAAYLPKFPKALKSEATAGLSLVDFDGNRDYRIFIPTTDKNLICFDKGMQPVKGWEFKGTEGEVSHPVQHYKIQNKDYLVFNDDTRLYILDRKGSVKVNFDKSVIISSNNPPAYDESSAGKGGRFLLSDADGVVYSFSLDGSTDQKVLEKFGPEHYFNYEDMNMDGLKEYVFFEKNHLEVFNQSGEKIISKRFDGQLSNAPEFHVFGPNLKRLGLVFKSKTDIFLIHPDGTIADGFPLRGSTPFTIGSLGIQPDFKNLLTGSSEPYLFNYAVK